LWKAFAFAARYGHQSLGDIRRMTIRDLNVFTQSVGELLSDEREHFIKSLVGSSGD